jgi:hypothetical protein
MRRKVRKGNGRHGEGNAERRSRDVGWGVERRRLEG